MWSTLLVVPLLATLPHMTSCTRCSPSSSSGTFIFQSQEKRVSNCLALDQLHDIHPLLEASGAATAETSRLEYTLSLALAGKPSRCPTTATRGLYECSCQLGGEYLYSIHVWVRGAGLASRRGEFFQFFRYLHRFIVCLSSSMGLYGAILSPRPGCRGRKPLP